MSDASKPTPHPAKFSAEILGLISQVLYQHLPPRSTILDPFAGIGGIHVLSDEDWCMEQCGPGIFWETYGVEIEPEWADQGPPDATWCGDFFKFASMPMDDRPWRFKFDAVITSPTYANRMADKHNAKDKSSRITYKHKLGRDLSPNNSGGMQWGMEYMSFHRRAWRRVKDLAPDLFIVNVKNHVRGGEVVDVAGFHRDFILKLGYEQIEEYKVPVRGMGFGQNHEARVPYEYVMVFKFPEEDE